MELTGRRLIAILCALCMLFTSMPVSVYADPDTAVEQLTEQTPASPTDLDPAQEEEQDIPTEEETGEDPEENEDPEDEEPETPEIEKPEADQEVSGYDDITVTGSLEGEDPEDYLIRFTPTYSQTLYLILTADGELEADVTDENTGTVKKFIPDETDQSLLTLPYYKVKNDSTYLIRLSAKAPVSFSLRMVKTSILKAEDESANTPKEEPAGVPDEPRTEPEDETQSETEPQQEPEAEPEAAPKTEPATEPEAEPQTEPETEPETESAAEPQPEPADKPEEPISEPIQENTEPEPKPAEQASPVIQIIPESEVQDVPATQTDLEAEPVQEEPVEIRIEANDSPVKADIVFMSDAGIPQDTELQVRELTEEEQVAYQARTVRALKCEDETYLYYTKYLAFALLHNGEPVELNAPATVSVTLIDVSEGIDALQVVRFGGVGAKLLESERTGDTISFRTSSLAVFGIGNALTPLDTQETELVSVEVLSFSPDAEVSLKETKAPEVEEGLEVLGTFRVEDQTKAAGTEETDGLWIKAELNEYAELAPMESVSLYRVEDGQTEILVEDLSQNSDITELDAEHVAVIKDTGFRHLTLTVNPEEGSETQTVTLDGMMPKESEATVVDVTADYADYEYPQDEQQAEEQVTEPTTEETGGTRTTLAAYDISISHPDGEYQPVDDKPISVEILDERITAEGNIKLWHIKDDGTQEQITDFIVEEGRIAFEAAGFSVYVVIDHEDETVVNPRVEFHFISKTDADALSTGTTAYYVTPRYTFRNMNNDIQCTQILSNSESLELITDPGNVSGIGGMPDQFFYGWYVVDPVEISGSSDKYGVGISDTNLYYSWPVHPEAVTFEKPITITETDVRIGDTIHWSLNGISGSGEVDSDGTLHVLLAPVYKKYNFVNFMLYARDENEEGQQTTPAAKNLMTRKLIAMGSAQSVEVKISDVRSNSKDSTHLIFTGWEYKDNHGNWIQKQTVDYEGAEMTDPGRDGVYLTNLSIDDEASIDLYPIFIEARWADFVSSSISGVGASFVGSRFLEAWGRALDENDQTIPRTDGENVFESLPVPERPGYTFAGWYAFATTDPDTGEITNLPGSQAQSVDINYVDTSSQDDYITHTIPVSTNAVKITDGEGNIVFDGAYFLDTGDGGSAKLFEAYNGQMRFYESLDRMKLYARWEPADADITIIYWTENALDDNYTATGARTVNTSHLRSELGGDVYSGSVITLEDLENCKDAEFMEGEDKVGIISNMILDDVGAVPKKEDPNALVAREEIFFELNKTLSDESKIIDGQGGTIFNVYFSRIEFTLVFHVGRDGHAKNRGKQNAANDNWIEYMYRDNDMPASVRPGKQSAGESYVGNTLDEYKMIINGTTYASDYITDENNIKSYYTLQDNANDAKLYTITAKYGAYIGNRWPSHANPGMEFPVGITTVQTSEGTQKSLYIWTAYYDSLYCAIAQARPTKIWDGTKYINNPNGANPDINGVYKYMSGELCASRDGNSVINSNHVHHLVAYFGKADKTTRFKQYHTLFEAVPGGWTPEGIETFPGTDYVADNQYEMTSWTINNTAGDKSEIIGHSFYEMDHDLPKENLRKSPELVISNLEVQYQLASEIDGYEMVYSCYEKNTRPNPEVSGQDDYHLYFFYRPKQYTLTLKFEDSPKTQQFFYKETLSDALDYEGYEKPWKEGYEFLGWYTNESGEGEPFDFAHSTMPAKGLVLYPAFSKLDYIVRIDPNGGEIDARAGGGASTGFRADYNEKVSAYNFLERNYLRIDDAEAAGMPVDKVYYYMNTQYISEEHDGRFVPSRLRNALYLTANEIQEYWANTYSAEPLENFTKRGATKYTDKNAWMDAYFGGHDLASLPKYRAKNDNEHYSFMGWYQVYENGTMASVPFDFNTKVKEDIKIQARWRLDGGYYLKYNTVFVPENGPQTHVTGKITQWYDPEDPTLQLYADQSHTHILRGPTDVTQGWVFRGWRIVRNDGTESEPHWVPIQLNENNEAIYYQPGENYVVEAQYATEIPENSSGAIIHMQAYYELENDTSRRPKVTELILDANENYGGGYLVDAGNLPDLDHPGTSCINTTDNLDGEDRPKQILFGDIQSNLALHLYRYATTKKDGKQFFWNDTDLYTLLGFDPEANPESPSTGEAYIPAYSPDSVIAVIRKVDPQDPPIILYAMWEPKIYVTFRNTTDENITVELSGAGESTEMVRIVNMVTGEYDRVEAGRNLVVPAGSEVKIVLPKANPGVDTVTATVLNDHIWKKMSVSGEFPEETDYGTGEADVPYGYPLTYTAVLQQDKEGIFVTYTEEDDLQVDYDVNGGVWTETHAIYEEVEKDHLYLLDKKNIINNKYRPTDPTREGLAFIGWTTNADIKEHYDFSRTTATTWNETVLLPMGGESLLDLVRREFLWDFSDPPPYHDTLYAVWSQIETVTFDLLKTGTTYHTWTGPEPVVSDVPLAYTFWKHDGDDRYVYYSVIAGDKVSKPDDPQANGESWGFIKWLYQNSDTIPMSNTPIGSTNDGNKEKARMITIETNAYDFETPVSGPRTLVTSWTKNLPQYFTFTVENHVENGSADEEFNYRIEVVDDKVYGKFTSNSNEAKQPVPPWGSVETTLKNNETYTVLITVQKITSPWTAVAIGIDVIDMNGQTIKSSQVVNCPKSTLPTYTSDYRYTLRITQTQKLDCVTSVAVENPNNDPVAYETDYITQFDFKSRFKSSNNSTCNTEFGGDPINAYDNGKYYSLNIIYTNVMKPIVAPTGYTSRRAPYLLLMLFGVILAAMAGVCYLRKRGPTDAECGTPEPATPLRLPAIRGKPPCQQGSLWTRSQGKRGDPEG